MASILTIEDGTGVAGANSYVSAATIRTYAVNHGVTLPATATVDPVEILAIKARDYIESLRDRLQGEKTTDAQGSQFPRTGVTVDGIAVDSDELPQCLLDGQCQLACDAYTQSLFVTSKGKVKTREKIGPLEFEYDVSSGSAPQPVFAAAMALLRPLLKSSAFFTERV